MSRRRPNKNNTAPSDDFLPTSVGFRTRRRQHLPSSSPLNSDDSTPSRTPHHLHFESRQPTQNNESLLDSLVPMTNENEDQVSFFNSPRRFDEDEVDDSEYYGTDEDEGSGNLADYSSFPRQVLQLFREKDKINIQRKYTALKDFMHWKGLDTVVTVRRFEASHGQDVTAAEQFEQEFFSAMMAQAGLECTYLLKLQELETLSMQLGRWKNTDHGKNSTKDEQEKHEKLTKQFLKGCEAFIKTQFKKEGSTAFDNVAHNQGEKSKGQITFKTVKNIYLPEILHEMSSSFKTLFMAERTGEEIKVTKGSWSGSTSFNRILRKDKERLWEDAMREKQEEDKCKARKANKTVREMNDLRAQLRVLTFNSSQQKDLHEQKISSLQDRNRDLHQQCRQARQDREASNERIQELLNEVQSLQSENQSLRQHIEELEASVPSKIVQSGTINNYNNYYCTPGKGVPKNEDLE